MTDQDGEDRVSPEMWLGVIVFAAVLVVWLLQALQWWLFMS